MLLGWRCADRSLEQGQRYGAEATIEPTYVAFVTQYLGGVKLSVTRIVMCRVMTGEDRQVSPLQGRYAYAQISQHV
jgi:hypothetical protein